MTGIQVDNISKKFKNTQALSQVTFQLAPNKIYGLLGRNGAGKTTLINVITNKLFPDEGTVTIDGLPSEENTISQSRIFSMAEKNNHPVEMRVKDGFRWAKVFYPSFREDYALLLAEKFGLPLKKKIKDLSTGYGSIFRLILTLASEAPYLIFDEPVLGLDAHHRELFYKELLSNYMENEKTILISTHLIDEVANILEEVIIINEGRLVLSDSLENVLSLGYSVSGAAEKVDEYTKGRNVIRTEVMGSYKMATLYEKLEKDSHDRMKYLGLELQSSRLQELFVSLTNS